ncbi:MAG: MG2 domain-containing protein, partial [Treponema sp.]|nr:MG2 domain-containing protein [Treponema sp.]
MKKYSALYLLMAAAVFFAVCSGTKEISAKPVMAGQYTINTPSAADNTADSLANDAAISAAFTLDYRPQKAEGDNEAETLSAADLAGAQNDSAGSGTTTGGGLRKLSDYKTVYYNPAAEKNRIEAIRAAQESTGAGQTENANAGPLTVIDWGPQGTYSSAIQRPSIYVLFSQPMVSLAALGEQSAVSPFVSIAPPVKGSFRWYGTAFLSFEGDEPCQSQQTYTITVADNAVSLDGTKISGDRVFTFLTETLSMKNIYPGEDFRNNNRGFWFDNNSVPPEAARQIGIEFNYPVQADDIKQYLDITDGKTSRKFNLKQITVYKVSAELSDKVDFETRITVTLKKGAKSSGGTRGTTADSGLSFRTPGVFKVDNFRQIPGYGRYRNLIEFYFSYPLDESTVQKAVSTNPVMQLGADNVEVQGNTVRLYNVPAGYGAKFAVVINNSVKDIYGRNLNEPFLCDIVFPQEPPPVGEANFLDYGDAMLEAQFPPRFLFEYKNIAADSWYLLAPVKNPWSPVPADTKRITLVPGNVNEKKFEEMDLSPYLNEKSKGFIQFRANMQLLTDDKLGDGTVRIRNTSNELNLQVTDLGLTVRYGFNKTAVLVTSLSTGKPVEGARVRMLNPSTVKTGADLDNMPGFAEAETDANGLAVLRTGSLVLRDNTKSTETWSRFQDPYIIAEKDGDKAVFTPYSHSSWRFGVSSKTPQYAEEVQSLAFLFSDRGLYKPGETMSFRGVDRSNVLGMYTVYQGDYTIALEADTYRPQRYVEIKGTTTSSGSFFGTINIPDDLNPGAYRLVYARADNPNTYIANIPITVAYFERLKFQASLSAPAAAIINGDDINLKLNASYLSGGSLSGASWESAWYSQMSTFRPRGIDMRGYIFGPRRVWDSQRYIASDKGVLSGQGSASISQKSGGDVIGAPYIYQAEARVTDISNQMVSAYRTVMVHPALFYIGLYRGSGGFAQAGQELSYDFILANTDGEKTSGSGLLLQTGEGAGSLKAELVREEWRRVQQPGVNGYIYDEYVSEQITDSVQSIPIKSGSGTIKVKPSKAGFYTLRVSAKDREGRTALTELNFYATGSGGGYWNMNNSNEL